MECIWYEVTKIDEKKEKKSKEMRGYSINSIKCKLSSKKFRNECNRYRIASAESGYSLPLYSKNGTVPSKERTFQEHTFYI